jgi:very-short-patch-repair endonuclease
MFTKQPMYPYKQSMAKELRRNMTMAEHAMWEALRRNSLDGLHFRRQHVIAGFIVDFYCHAARLVVEIDGPVHEQQRDHDVERSGILESYGLRVIRFTNDEVLYNLPEVLGKIREVCCERLRPNPPAPFPAREGGGSDSPPLRGEGLGERTTDSENANAFPPGSDSPPLRGEGAGGEVQ